MPTIKRFRGHFPPSPAVFSYWKITTRTDGQQDRVSHFPHDTKSCLFDVPDGKGTLTLEWIDLRGGVHPYGPLGTVCHFANGEVESHRFFNVESC